MLKYIILVGALSIICRETNGQLQWANIFGTNGKNVTINIPTVLPARPFNPTHICELLKLSMQGIGRDSETILKILATHPYSQRYEIAATYKTLYNQDLVQKLFTEFDGNILDVIQYLFWPAEKMYAKEFRDAVQGLGTDERSLIELTASLDGQMLRRVSSAYQQMYEKTLEKDIKGDTSGFFRDLLLELIKGREPDNSPNSVALPSYTVDTLNRLGSGQWSNNKDTIRDIFCKKSFSELAEIFAEYEHRNGHKIEVDIENEFSSDVKKTLLAIAKCARNRPLFLAEQLNKSMSNFGINHNVLHRIIVGRSEIDLGNIKEEFAKINNVGINVWLKSAIEGNYWSLIVQLAGYAPEYFKD
ncbi:hypothetical protein HA402_014508 [Bradysia odoriphaga]|nr:hypothetical protein HA402_014508 [Bradysia odoriphaga]